MKRFLSCVILCVLIISLVPCNQIYADNSAYSKSDDIKSFLKILNIYLPTEVENAEQPIKKSEFVYLLAKATNEYTASDKSYLVFNDVKLDFWAHDEIVYAYERKYVNGKGDNSFGVDDNISENDAASIIMRALGFEKLSKAMNQNNNLSVFKEYHDLFKNVNMDNVLTVNDAYIMIYNMLLSPYVSWNYKSDECVIDNKKKFIEDRFDIIKGTGRVTANHYTAFGIGGSNYSSHNIMIDEKEYEGNTSYLGYNVDYFYKDDDEEVHSIVFMMPTNNNDVTKIYSENIVSIERSGANIKIEYEDEDKYTNKITFPLTCDFVYNGKVANLDIGLLEKLYKERFGYITIVENNENCMVDVVSYETVIVENVSTYDDVIFGKNGEKISLESSKLDYLYISKDKKPVDLKTIQKSDVLEVAQSLDKKYIVINVTRYELFGKITSVDDTNLFIDGIEYDISNYLSLHPQEKIKLGLEATFLLNSLGEIVAMIDDSEAVNGEFVYLIDAKLCTDTIDHYGVIKVVTMDANIITYKLAKKVNYNGGEKASAESIINKPLLAEVNTGGETKKVRKLIYIEKNSDGDIRTIYTPDGEQLDGTVNNDDILSLDATEKRRKTKNNRLFLNSANDMDFPEFYFDSDTKILMVPSTSADEDSFLEEMNYEKKTPSFLTDAQDFTVEAYNFNDYNVAGVVIIKQDMSFDSKSDSSSVILVTSIGTSINADGETVSLIVGYMDGKKVKVQLYDNDVLYLKDKSRNIKIGDVVRFGYNNKSVAIQNQYIKNVYDDFDITNYPEGRNDGNAYVIGNVVSRDKSYLKLSFSEQARPYERVFYGTDAVTIFDSATGKAHLGDMGDLSQGSKVMLRVYYSNISDIIMIK